MRLNVTRAAQRGLARLAPSARTAMLQRLEAIASDPFARHANVERIKGEPDAFRLRQGGWRALYRVDRGVQEVQVVAVEPRGSAYR